MQIEVLWQRCLERLQDSISNQLFNMWIRPLQMQPGEDSLTLYAPNQFVKEWVQKNYQPLIAEILSDISPNQALSLSLAIGSSGPVTIASQKDFGAARKKEESDKSPKLADITEVHEKRRQRRHSYHIPLNPDFSFTRFVSGKSNQLAVAAAKQVAENLGSSYNPLFIYGQVGLGKTHLMQAIGNAVHMANPEAKIVYLSSERYVSEMVRAIQTNSMGSFKEFYRSCDLLLIDDIQFFAGKDRSQEEFFHTFNALLEGQQQMVFTCDRYPREINGLEDRLKSRFGWGLTVAVEPPELETRVAILISKAEQTNIHLPEEVAFFIGKRLRSNVRELEGALKRVIAHIHFTGQTLTVEVAKEALRDLLSLQERSITIDNIQKTVADYFKLRRDDLTSQRRTRSLARPRQLAMALTKELTSHSLPEIGAAFGGRDHTTVLHACRKVKELVETDPGFAEDYQNLMKTLTS